MARPEGTKLYGRRRYMTEEELERFMTEARKSGRKYGLLFALCYYYAMRVEEIVTLMLSDLNLPSHQITIRAKKGGRFRVYDLPEKIEKRYLLSWLKERATLEGASENPFLFPATTLPRSGHLSRDAAQATFRILARRAGIGMPRSIHDLRHSAAQQMIRNGDDLATVQGWLRHRDIMSTKAYISDEVTAEHERKMAARNARFL